MSKYANKEDITKSKYVRKEVEDLEIRPLYEFKANGAKYTG
jgi:hypothetical protein